MTMRARKGTEKATWKKNKPNEKSSRHFFQGSACELAKKYDNNNIDDDDDDYDNDENDDNE